MKKKKLSYPWAQVKDQRLNFDLVAEYATYKNGENDLALNDKTITDLDFQDFFKYIDRTGSAVGQQYLYHQFIKNEYDENSIEAQEKLAQYFNKHQEKRKKSQLILQDLSQGTDYYFPFLTFGKLPEKVKHLGLVKILQVLTAACVVVSLKYHVFVLVLIPIFAVNLMLHYMNKQRIGKFTVYFSRLIKLSNTLKKLMPLSQLSETEKTQHRADIKVIEKITSRVLFLKTDNLQTSEFGSFVWFFLEIIKILSLSEITTFEKLVDRINDKRDSIENIYIAIGKIDVAISICSLRDGLKYYSIPQFIEGQKELNIKGLYHPLIEECVSNDIHLKQKSLLLTGSNMAGKSTFIKTINLNALSSQVMNTSFAQAYKSQKWKIMTSMTIKDDLENDSSYYMEEVNSIQRILEASQSKDLQFLFTIDEIFKGTNTIERVSTAKAILEYLNKNNHMVLISTHDIELTKMLEKDFDLYYFQEDINNDLLSFDYKLKKGKLKKSNAIRILEISGYPEEITENAKALALSLIEEKTGINPSI